MELKLALKVDDLDNVATIFADDITDGTVVEVRDKKGQKEDVYKRQPYVNIERSIIKEYRKTIWRPFVKGLQEYEMIQDGDRVAVCISGGKDSMLLAKCLQQLKRQSDTKFELEFIVMDPGYQPENRKLIEENAALMNIPVRIFDSDIFDIVVDVDQSPCYLCAKMCIRDSLYIRKMIMDLQSELL